MAFEVWILVALMIFVVFFVVKLINKKQAFVIRLVLFIFLFFTLSISYVVFSNNIDIGSYEGLSKLGGLYVSWLGGIVKNVGRISSYVVHQDWSVKAEGNLTAT